MWQLDIERFPFEIPNIRMNAFNPLLRAVCGFWNDEFYVRLKREQESFFGEKNASIIFSGVLRKHSERNLGIVRMQKRFLRSASVRSAVNFYCVHWMPSFGCSFRLTAVCAGLAKITNISKYPHKTILKAYSQCVIDLCCWLDWFRCTNVPFHCTGFACIMCDIWCEIRKLKITVKWTSSVVVDVIRNNLCRKCDCTNFVCGSASKYQHKKNELWNGIERKA